MRALFALTPTKPSTTRFSLEYLIAFARERVSSAVVQFPYTRAIESLFVYFQHSAQQKIGWHYLDGETDSLGRGFETAIANRAITLFAPAREQVGRRAVIKILHYYSLGLNLFELYDLQLLSRRLTLVGYLFVLNILPLIESG